MIALAEALMKTLVTTPTKPVFKSTDSTGGASRGYAKVRLGITPSQGKRKDPGLLIEKVAAETSAADAGLKKDDVILKWDDEPMSDFGELLTKLREKNPGDVVTLHIKRDGSEQDVKVTLKASEK